MLSRGDNMKTYYAKDLCSWMINWKALTNDVRIQDIASLFLNLRQINKTTFEGGLFNWDPKICNNERVIIDIEKQTFKYRDNSGDVSELFNLLCPQCDFLYFLFKVKGIKKEQYAKWFKFKDGTKIYVRKNPIKDMTKYIKDWEYPYNKYKLN